MLVALQTPIKALLQLLNHHLLFLEVHQLDLELLVEAMGVHLIKVLSCLCDLVSPESEEVLEERDLLLTLLERAVYGLDRHLFHVYC